MRSFLATSGEKIDRIAAEEELRSSDVKNARQDLDARLSMSGPRPSESLIPRPAPEAAKLAADYKLLGVRPGADLQAVENAWRELARRADPKRFPSGSEEEKRAAEILRSVNEAYARIREAVNPTEGRFGKLEL